MLKKIVTLGCWLILLAGCSSTPTAKLQLSTQTDKQTDIYIGGQVRLLAQLPDAVLETSGLAQQEHLFWTINDSGDGPYLYALNAQFKLAKRISVKGAKNIDWEELAQDETYLYIADCGNNRGHRTQLQIYKVSWQELSRANTQVSAETLTYEYADRTGTQTPKNHNYDCEALASVGNELWLFTKNRQDEKTNLYRLDKNSPQQSVFPVASYDVNGLITAADYDPQLQLLALLGYKKNKIFGASFVWIVPVNDNEQSPLVWSQARYRRLKPYAQWEAILWSRKVNRGQLILTSEKSPLLDVSIGELDLRVSKKQIKDK